MLSIMQNSPFKKNQLENARVKEAYAEKEKTILNYFKEKGFSYSGFNLFIRAFKAEQKLEVWIKEKDNNAYSHLHTYNFSNTSGIPGPKRKEGDLQIPEGVYRINHFNPQSNFHLSLGINYPNASDKILSDKKQPGSSIYIHGNCVTVGCIPITDDKIKELYILAVEAKNNGQESIPVHIFPAKFNDYSFTTLKENETNKSLFSFWRNLKSVYHDFENTKTVKNINVNKQGEYEIID
jgi:murein L,D-transpeptidase YafK